MGNEASCSVSFGKKSLQGKALLESSELIFRGEDEFRLKIKFSDVKSAKAVDGALRVQTSERLVVFELGARAAKWCEKILHPKTRIEKLGVKPNAAISLVGKFSADFPAELEACTQSVTQGNVANDADGIFVATESRQGLAQVPKFAKILRGAAALWIVYPKGQKQITENDVIAAGRKAGLKDIKAVSFSPTQTALKFVIPVANR
jgi:hypothetical protein